MRRTHSIRLAALSVGHLCIDAYAMMIFPMVLYFGHRFGLSDLAASSLAILSTVATSLTQPVVAWWGDRGMPRSVALAGPAIAGIGAWLMLTADSLEGLVAWLIVSGLGVSVLHPEGVLLAGDTLHHRRPLAIAIFLFWGTVGIAAGPFIIPRVIDRFGTGAAWAIAIPAVVCSLVLLAAYFRAPIPDHHKAHAGVSLGRAFAGRWRDISLLVGVNTARGMAMTGATLALTWLAKERGGDKVLAGTWVAVFLLVGGIGSLLCGAITDRRLERPLLVATMLAAMVPLFFISSVTGPLFWVAMALAGLLGNATVPMVVAISQRLVPAGARVASALMMGLSWSIGSSVGSLVVGGLRDSGVQDPSRWAFAIMAAAMIPAAICAWFVRSDANYD